MTMFRALYETRLLKGVPQDVWTVKADYTITGGEIIHICLAENEFVARETARLMNEVKR